MGGYGLIGRVTSKEWKIFPMELGFFEKLGIFQVGSLKLFHNGRGNFRVVETFTRSDVFSFSCRLRFSFFLMAGGGRLIFFQKLKVSHGIKIFPVT